jgi:DNA helicase-2/ATP-dependent DNA helicase PcrA
VLLSTIHRVKGREWPRVIVFGASAGLLPHRLSDDIEGERRVFHVAITRGKDRVVVIAPDETPSIFVAELDGTRRHEPAATQRRADTSPRRESSEKSRRPGRARTGATDPAVPAGPPSPARAAAEQALRSWRRAAASRDGVPPFVILSDRELVGIAERRPATLRELSRCPGIGPIRLDRWGDEMISVLDGASTAEP